MEQHQAVQEFIEQQKSLIIFKTPLSQIASFKLPIYLLVTQEQSQSAREEQIITNLHIDNKTDFHINFKIIEYMYGVINQVSALKLRYICKQSKTSIDSYVLASYIQTFKQFPPTQLSIPLIQKLLTSLAKFNLPANQPQISTITLQGTNNQTANRTVTILNALLKNAILNNNKGLIKYSLKYFIKFMRNTRPYKEFMMSKKHLELTVIREILTQYHLMEHAINVNCTDSFMFLLKEFKVSYKDQLFENPDRAKVMFGIINQHGNMIILKEVFKFYQKLYTELLIVQVENTNISKNQKNIWIVTNCLMSNHKCLKFNLKLLEREKGIQWIREEFELLSIIMAFCIKSKDLQNIQILVKYVDLERRDSLSFTHLELACKLYDGQNTVIIELLLSQETSNQLEIPINPNTLKCHLTYMIKKNVPIKIINQALSLFDKKSITKYKNRENKSLLHIAIRQQNLELVRTLLQYFTSITFFQRATDGLYPQIEAYKSQNLELRKIVHDYIQYKENQEFMEKEWIADPTVPEKLLLLKKQLFPSGVDTIQKFEINIAQIHKAKRQKSLFKPKLQDFDEFREHIEFRNLSEFSKKQRLHYQKLNTVKLNSQPQNRHRNSINSKHLSNHSFHDSIIGQNAIKVNFEKKNSVFHKEQYKYFTKQNCKYLKQEQVLEKYKNLENLFKILNDSLRYVSQQPETVYSQSYLFQGSKTIDNAELILSKSYPKQIRFRMSTQQSFTSSTSLKKIGTQQSLISEKPNSNLMFTSIQTYLTKMMQTITTKKEQVDEMSDFLVPIITSMTKQQVKYNDLQNEQSMDPNKMTIAQRHDYDKHQKSKKKVFQQLAKDYSNKLKSHSLAKKNEFSDQNEIDHIISNTDKSDLKLNRQLSNKSQDKLKKVQNNAGGFEQQIRKKKTKIQIDFLDKSQKDSTPKNKTKINEFLKKGTVILDKQKQQRNQSDFTSKFAKEQSPLILPQGYSLEKKNNKKVTIQVKNPISLSKKRLNTQSKSKLNVIPNASPVAKIVGSFIRRSTLTPSTLSLVRINSKALRPAKSGSSLQSSSDIEEEKTQINFDSADQSENQKEIMISCRTDEQLTEEHQDIVFQLENEQIEDPNELMELNMIHEVSQNLESSSPQSSSKARFLMKKQKLLNGIMKENVYQTEQENMLGGILKLHKVVQLSPGDYKSNQLTGLNKIDEPLQSKTPANFDVNPIPKHHIKNGISDDNKKIAYPVTNPHSKDISSDLNGFSQASAFANAILEGNEGLGRQQPFSGQNQSTSQKQKYMISNSSVKGLDNQPQIDDYRSMFSGISNMEQKLEMRSFVKTKNQSLKLSSNHATNTRLTKKASMLPPQHPNRVSIQYNLEFSPSQEITSPLRNTSNNINHFQYNKYRYKDENEARQIQKIVKNINILRQVKGSPLRLYPELFKQQQYKSSDSYFLSRNNSQNLKTSQVKNSLQSTKVYSPHSNSQQEIISDHRQKSIIIRNIASYKTGLMLGNTSKYAPILIKSNTASKLQLYSKTSKNSMCAEQNYDYDINQAHRKKSNAKHDQIRPLKSKFQSFKHNVYDIINNCQDIHQRKTVYSMNSKEHSLAQSEHHIRNKRLISQEFNKDQGILVTIQSTTENGGQLTSSGMDDDQYEGLGYSHQKFLGTLHAHPSMKTILKKDKSYYNKLKNSRIEVPIQLDREIYKKI